MITTIVRGSVCVETKEGIQRIDAGHVDCNNKGGHRSERGAHFVILDEHKSIIMSMRTEGIGGGSGL